MTSPAGDEDDVPPGVTCSRCGGPVRVRPARSRNPFLPRPPVHLMCSDCGLEFDVERVEHPPSGKLPWE